MNELEQSPWSAPPAPVDADIVMFLLGPDGERIEDDTIDRTEWTIADVVRAFRESVQSDRINDPLGRRRLRSRPVQGTGRPTRPGYRDEIMVTLRSSPADAVAEAVRGRFFDPPIQRLVIDPTSLTSRRYEVSWSATFRGGSWRKRAVRVRLYASPSLNVTALAMSPIRPRSIARRGFIRAGNRVMDDLGDRLDDLVEASGVAPRTHR